MFLSVIIPAYNEQSHIAECLQCLEVQSLGNFEVIVIDNGSTDRTNFLAGAFRETLKLRVQRMEPGSISAARNLGASLANGQILAFLDADCRPGPQWVESAVFASFRYSLWGAHYRIPPKSTWVGKIWSKYQATEKSGGVAFLPGGCVFIHREDFLHLGGFNESIETSEDVEFCARAKAMGMEVVARPELAVVHEGTPQSVPGFYRQSRWHGRHVARNFLANLPSTKNAGVVALSVYALVMFWLSVITCVLAPLPIAAITVALFFLPPALLAARRATPTDAPSLFVLYVVYALARAASLTHISKGRKR